MNSKSAYINKYILKNKLSMSLSIRGMAETLCCPQVSVILCMVLPCCIVLFFVVIVYPMIVLNLTEKRGITDG